MILKGKIKVEILKLAPKLFIVALEAVINKTQK
jgi:hypothetical protein